jgi:CRP-like cAMP-binding protein
MAQEFQIIVQDLWHGLGEIKSKRSFASGLQLFAEGDSPNRVYLVEKGQVRITIATDRGGTRSLATAGPGTLLGLSEVIGGEPHKVSAYSVGDSEVSCVERHELLEFLAREPGLCMQIVRLLSEDLHSLYHQFRDLSSRPAANARRRAPDGRFH